MDKKQNILNEIKRTAASNGGQPLGRERFFSVTGIKQADWFGKSWNNWNNWGDALQEAGFTRNQKQEAIEEDSLVESLITLIRKLDRFPIEVELKREAASNPNFPSCQTLGKRLGTRKKKLEKVVDFCRRNPNEYEDVLQVCEPLVANITPTKEELEESDGEECFGFVYLIKSGKYYKIGKTNKIDRRQYEIGMQLPEKIVPVHSIRTDDPSGIESYWHNRFRDKRLEGEWFNLNASDVKIFKKRKFM